MTSIDIKPVQNKSQYKHSLFPELKDKSKELIDGINYTEETLNYMSSAKRANELTKKIIEYFTPEYIIDASAGIGGNTLSFALDSQIKKVISYEALRDRWVMLHNNVKLYELDTKVNIYNTNFSIGEDLQFLNIEDDQIKSKTVVYFDPPWLPPNVQIDKSNYIKSGIVFSGKTLENWCKKLIDEEGYLGVVFHLPPDYTFMLANQYQIHTKPYTLIICTKNENAMKLLDSYKIRKKYDEPVVELEIKDDEISDELIYNFIKQDNIPTIILQTYLTQEFPKRYITLPFYNPKLFDIYERGMLLTDIEFLTRLSKNDEKYLVLYISSNTGEYIQILSEMFPEFNFEVYGSNLTISQTKNMNVYKTNFNDSLIPQYNEFNTILICDIFGKSLFNDPNKNDNVNLKLFTQDHLIKQIKPVRSLIKFELFDNPNSEFLVSYYDGILNLMPYSNVHSNEVRLEVGHSPILIEYNNMNYKTQMMYFHTDYRIQTFTFYHKMYGWSYDTIREFYILMKYVNRYGKGYNQIIKYSQVFDKLSDNKIVQIMKNMVR